MLDNKSLPGRCFRGFVLPVLEYCSIVWCSPADAHFKLMNRALSGARFLTGGVFECDISHRRSVVVLCMLYKIRCNPMHPLNGALPGPYVLVRVTRCALVAYRYTYAPPRCWTSQYLLTSIPLSVSLWNDLADPVLIVWDYRIPLHSAGYKLCSGCISVYLCAASLLNLSIPLYFYSPLSVPLERSCWPGIR